MSRPVRPLIAIPARFAAGTSALRYAAEVNARALVEAVWRAGGEPATIHPHAPDGSADPGEVADRLGRFDGVLLPGGGDIAPGRYGAGPAHESVYDVDDQQDGFDLEAARQALRLGMPLLAVCRGLQVVNTVLGGTLAQDMGGPEREHRHVVHPVELAPGSVVARAAGVGKVDVSCYHHQRVERLGRGLRVCATAADGTVEALELPSNEGWFTGVQWHPEDTAHHDRAQHGLFDALVREAGSRAR
ncbi:gamma-glutamyl-gamma-aminobutyrate hydrolase family protein [Streptomyces sp. AM 4-1-1]|uniref:gamma-glutamyl-gamma-aminobutyrate hydrolase family protein n=1 Tax=Streptomyces sp. AM 4-1-1 TaxID=3028710 RepID=UPI0023B8A68A|nr:gamma-glutamyl-gamma-aminobutyrate hydrolase family protein [Streptomyces sp. AM 4-1-1]WEH37037.1 gamma-glutamyl-gamma-aminobutyrate hydrolase family protein [Streptomyces sp. AM 4-1-1]